MKSESINSMQDLGDLVRRRRKEVGMSQRELAGFAGVGTRSVSQVEGGKATTQADVIFRLTRALGIELEARTR